MTQYLDEIEHAVAQVLPGVWSEHDTIQHLQPAIDRRQGAVDHEYRQARALMADAEDVMFGVGRFWENYHGADADLERARNELAAVRDQFQTRQFARRSRGHAAAVRETGSLYRARGTGKLATDITQLKTPRVPIGDALGVVHYSSRQEVHLRCLRERLRQKEL
jgi:hypothetical protein